jgi:hypothetical protein
LHCRAITRAGGRKSKSATFRRKKKVAITQGSDGLGVSNDIITTLWGGKTFDIYLNNAVYWSNVPAAAWEYKIGGYHVLKKWLSYRDQMTR